jgi:uncharacterized protein involved in type VI secretion and phage assembly
MATPVNGLQTGKVLQLENDPKRENRILVNIPAINKKKSGGVWVKLASADAGNNRGFLFLPEIGDDVIVGFINGDPGNPVMLGMLYSKAKKPPIKIRDTNHEKGITTRSKMHIAFNDDSKTITIDTPAGNRIQLDESGTRIEIKDQHNNSITMNASGISIKSPMNIEIKAGIDLTLDAGASLKLGATSVSIKAAGGLSIEGAGGAKLSSAATVDIRGSLVRIN